MRYPAILLSLFTLVSCEKEIQHPAPAPPQAAYSVCHDTLSSLEKLAYHHWVMDSGYHEKHTHYMGQTQVEKRALEMDSLLFVYHPDAPRLVSYSNGDSISGLHGFGHKRDSVQRIDSLEFMYYIGAHAALMNIELNIIIPDSHPLKVQTLSNWYNNNPGRSNGADQRSASVFYMGRKNMPACK